MKAEITKEELSKMNEEILEEITKIEDLNRGKIALQLAQIYLLFQNEKYQGIKEWFKELRKGLKTGQANYKEVLTGIEITSNFLTEENVRNLLEQKEEANAYMTLYRNYLQEGKDRVKTEKDFESPIAPNIKEEMDIRGKKVKQLSKQYVK